MFCIYYDVIQDECNSGFSRTFLEIARNSFGNTRLLALSFSLSQYQFCGTLRQSHSPKYQGHRGQKRSDTVAGLSVPLYSMLLSPFPHNGRIFVTLLWSKIPLLLFRDSMPTLVTWCPHLKTFTITGNEVLTSTICHDFHTFCVHS